MNGIPTAHEVLVGQSLMHVRHEMAKPKWPAIEQFVAQTIFRVGAPPMFLLKAGINDNQAKQVRDEVSAQWRGHAVSMYAGMITVWNNE